MQYSCIFATLVVCGKQFGAFQNSKSEMAHAAGVAHGKACSTLPKRPN